MWKSKRCGTWTNPIMTEPTLIIVSHYVWGWRMELCTTRSHIHWTALTAVLLITSTKTVRISPGSIYHFVCLSPGFHKNYWKVSSESWWKVMAGAKGEHIKFWSWIRLCLSAKFVKNGVLDMFWIFQERTGLLDLGGGIVLLPVVF